MHLGTWDVIVVGGGPAGGAAARAAAASGLRTLVLEEHAAIGAPPHCSGKLSVHAFAEFALPQSLARNALRAATLYSPDGRSASVRRDVIDSYVVDRDTFDRWLMDRAEEAGAEVLLGARVRHGSRIDGHVVVEGERRRSAFRARASIIIDAEGARALLPATLGVRPRRVLIHGLQYEMEGLSLDEEDMPELYFGQRWAPGFFAWIMPLGGRAGRVGLCIDPRLTVRPPIYYLQRLMAEHPVVAPRVRGARIDRKLAGRIPILGGRRPSYGPGVLVAGDAAGHVKATSGGGIYFSMVAGQLAAQAAAEVVGGRPRALPRYERAWVARFGREVAFTVAVRRMLNALPEANLSRLIGAIAQNALLRRTLEEHGDTQYQSRLLRPVLLQAIRSWRGLSLAPALAAALLRGAVREYRLHTPSGK